MKEKICKVAKNIRGQNSLDTGEAREEVVQIIVTKVLIYSSEI